MIKERESIIMLLLARVVAVRMSDVEQKIKNFCLIQLQLLSQKEKDLRKQILDCKIQKEFLSGLLSDLDNSND